MVKIAVLASFNMDLVMRVERRPEAGETVQGDFAMHLGGKGFNQAVAARRLGADVAVTGRIGDDDFGRMFLAALDDEGIDRRAVVIDPTAGTGVATIYVEPNGDNTIVQSPRANRNASIDDVIELDSEFDSNGDPIPVWLRKVDGLLLTLECSQLVAHQFALAMTEYGRRERVLLNAAPAAEVDHVLLNCAGCVVVNEIEAGAILGRIVRGVEEAIRASGNLTTAGWREAVVTLGDAGSTASGRVHTLAYDVPVVDTTGAGDAFCAALAVRLAEGADLADAMRFANAAGALACTRHGAYPSMPYRADVEALIETQGSSR